MPKIKAETADGLKEIECEPGRKLVLCLEDNGIDILHRCGGNARCTTCRVELIEGELAPMREPEQAVLSTKTDLGPNTRLSCQNRVESDLHVKVINQVSVSGLDAGPRPLEENTP
jgi:ferredoxin